MKVLTIHQPYAWAVCAGIKRFENRSFATAHRGEIAIHAGLSRASLGVHDDWDLEVMVGLPQFDLLPFGAIVGFATIVDCLDLDAAESFAAKHCPEQDEFAEGPFCWLMANARLLEAPIPLKGRLGLFDVPDSLFSSIGSGNRV